MSVNDTVVVDALVTEPAGEPSRYTSYRRLADTSSSAAAQLRPIVLDEVLAPVGTPGCVGGVVSGGPVATSATE